jgi:hypothetical protein
LIVCTVGYSSMSEIIPNAGSRKMYGMTPCASRCGRDSANTFAK